MPLIAGRRGPPILRRGMIVLVIRQSLSRKQVALSCAAALVNGAAADPHRAGLVETDILDHEIIDCRRCRDGLSAREPHIQKEQHNSACSEHRRGA